LQGFLLQVEVSEIVVHEADEPNAVIDLFDSKLLTSQYNRDVDLLAVQAKAPQDVMTTSRSWNG